MYMICIYIYIHDNGTRYIIMYYYYFTIIAASSNIFFFLSIFICVNVQADMQP